MKRKKPGRIQEGSKGGGPIVMTVAMAFLHGVHEDSSGGYELLTTHAGAPLVRSRKTGRSFALSWDEIIGMARAAGVDRPAPAAKGER